MLKPFSLACLVLLVSGVLSCSADVAPTDTADPGPAPTSPRAEEQSFEVHLSRDVTAETVIPAIVAAGRAELRTRCNDVGLWGGAGLTFVCTLPFLPIFF